MPIIAIILTGLKFTVNIPTHLLADELVFFLDDSNSVHKRRKAALLNKQVRLFAGCENCYAETGYED